MIIKPKISVITATFNAAETISDLIASLQKQSDQNFEWVVADGGSSDNTLDLIRGSSLASLKIISGPDFGIYDGLNKAILASSGDFYIITGGDDVLHEDAIKNYNAILGKGNIDIVTTPIRVGATVTKKPSGMSWLHGQFAYVYGHAVASCFRKSLHDKLGLYSKKYPIAADQLFISLAAKSGASIYVGNFLAGCFGTSGTSSRDVLGSLCEFYRIQLEMGENKAIQTILFALRIIKNFNRINTRKPFRPAEK